MEGDFASSVLTGETASPLAAVSWLKMLCGHPSLVKEAADDYIDCDVDSLVQDSAKLQVLISLVLRLKKSGHKALIFSQSTKMLDTIELALADCDNGTAQPSVKRNRVSAPPALARCGQNETLKNVRRDRKVPICIADGCTNANIGCVCIKHGAKVVHNRCSSEGCPNSSGRRSVR